MKEARYFFPAHIKRSAHNNAQLPCYFNRYCFPPAADYFCIVIHFSGNAILRQINGNI